MDHIPLAQREDFTEAEKKETGRPAFKVRLQSPRFDRPLPFWLSDDCLNGKEMANCIIQGGSLRMDQLGPARLELVGHCADQSLLGEFLSPPNPTELGKLGVLAVQGKDGSIGRISLDELGKKKITIDPTTRTEIKITKVENEFILYDMKMGHKKAVLKAGQKLPIYPAVSFDLWQDGDYMGEVRVHSRAIGNDVILRAEAAPIQKIFGISLSKVLPNAPAFVYHASDVRATDRNPQQLRGVLQFVRGPGGKLFYRSFRNEGDIFDCEGSGKVDPKSDTSLWGKMQWKFRVVKEFDHAKYKVWYSPVDIPLGKERPRDKVNYPSVLEMKITPTKGKPESVYVQFGSTKTIQLGEQTFKINYTYKTKKLDFTVELVRAEQKVDPGTMRAASYTSDVRVYDEELGLEGKPVHISMNHPLDHRGYKFYQSELEVMDDVTDVQGRPVCRSGFTVSYDPGLGMKYAGSIMLGIGILMMFYLIVVMRAYVSNLRRAASKAANAMHMNSEPKAAE